MKWRRGTTILTPTTKRWSQEQLDHSDEIEKSMIFDNFKSIDSGKSREMICKLNELHPLYSTNAGIIESAPLMIHFIQSFISDFEGDYVLGGEIVDNPNALLVANYKAAKLIIKKATGQESH